MKIFDYTDQNHLSYGYNGGSFNLRRAPTDTFDIRYSAIRRPPGDFRQELMETARCIQRKTNKPLWVCFSGGMDSEVTLLAFVLAGIPVQAATIRMNSGLNDHDIRYAFKFCAKHGIPQKVFDLDLSAFLAANLARYDYLQCCSPQFAPVLWLMEQIIASGGLPIVGNGDACLVRVENTNDFYFVEKEKYFSYYGLLLHHKAEGVPAFLQYTPELFLSFLKSKRLASYIAGECRRQKLLSISKYKHDIYSEFLELEKRPVYNGFENVTEIDTYYRDLLKAKFPGSDCEIRIPYHRLVQILSG